VKALDPTHPDNQWQQGGAGWNSTSAYILPSDIATGKGLAGTQFIDVDGDGRQDLLLARQNGSQGVGIPQVGIWTNTGQGWQQKFGDVGLVPTMLSGAQDEATGVRFTDIDGDGLKDIIQDGADVFCGTHGCEVCVNNHAPSGPCGGPVTHPRPSV
jgi:hypothetical protein